MSIDFNPEDPATRADPYPIFARLRDEDPCHWSPRLKSWILTRYDDVKAVTQDGALSSDRLRPFFDSLPSGQAQRIADIVRYLSLWMVFNDPPEHTRLRRLTSKVLSVAAMQGMRPQVRSIADELLDGLRGRDAFDFIAEFAGPLPCLVIMAMLGVPREDLGTMKRLSDDMALFIGSSRVSDEKYDTAQAATHEMAEYFRALIAQRRATPTDDLLSRLVRSRDGDDCLSDDELVATCILLLFAGHETTTNHLANGLLSLMRFPGEMARLRADPSLTNAAVEEMLRHEGPSAAQVRIVRVEHERHGKTLKAGDRVFMMLHAANRDPRAYADPDRLDIGRDGPAHLSFGYGPHICLGFPLARTEGQVAFPAVLARYASIEPATETQEWINSLVFRGMKALPVRVKPA